MGANVICIKCHLLPLKSSCLFHLGSAFAWRAAWRNWLLDQIRPRDCHCSLPSSGSYYLLASNVLEKQMNGLLSVSNDNILSAFSQAAAGILLGKCGSPLSAACSEVKILYRRFFFFCLKTCFLSLCTHHNCPDRLQTPEMPPEEKQNLISKNTHSLPGRWCTCSEKVDSP